MNDIPPTPDYDTPEWQKLFANLLDDIEEQRCVLLLGPEAVRVGGRPLHQCLRGHLMEEHSGDISYYYEREGFYLFRDKMAKEDVQRGVRRFFKEQTLESEADETTFLKIARIPFHLVLSINPDNYLSEACYKYGVRHRSAFFHHRGDAVQEVELPSKDSPLFYHLCGRYTQDDSLVLDYDDLFRLLQATLGSPGLPEKLRTALQRAKTFVFLGFQFDKWYSQLLLRLLSGEKAIRKYALNTEIADADTETFLVQQFEIAFLGDDQAFFQHLYQCCERQGLVRELSEPNSPLARRIIRRVQEGNLGEALSILGSETLGSAAAQKDSVLLSAQYANLLQERARGILDSRDYAVRYNRLADSILELSRILP